MLSTAWLVISSHPEETLERIDLYPDQVLTIGRSSENQLVLDDDRCSRYHAEVYCEQKQWYIRDLQSRNGTAVGQRLVRRNMALEDGDVIRIGHVELRFCELQNRGYDADDTSPNKEDDADFDLDTGYLSRYGGEQDSKGSSAWIDADGTRTEIKQRQSETGFLADAGALPVGKKLSEANSMTSGDGKSVVKKTSDAKNRSHPLDGIDRHAALVSESVTRRGIEAARLCRLAYLMARAEGVQTIAQLAIDSLIDSCAMTAGAVLLLRPASGEASRQNESITDRLHQVASSITTKKRPYRRIAKELAEMVLRDGEALLGSTPVTAASESLASGSVSHDEKGKAKDHASGMTLICAPIRSDKKVLGLLHIYSDDPRHECDAEDLDYALAVADTLAASLENWNQRDQLAGNLSKVYSENAELRKRLGTESRIIGTSPEMQAVYRLISRAGTSRTTVLVHGESGVGKELVARAIHASSDRRDKPLICLNCAALAEDLLTSELFGYEKGAFTGANEQRIGKFEAADGGTLVLDEIGEMSSSLQAKFLRVLEGHPFERIGGHEPVRVDVRVVAATNRNLEHEVSEGRFRRDLFFRLRVLEIDVPPLRKRKDDIIELALHFLARFREETGRKIAGFTSEAINRLVAYRWPGNVRELKNVIERAVLLADADRIDVDDLLLSRLTTPGGTAAIARSDGGQQDEPIASGAMDSDDKASEPCSLAELEKHHIEHTLTFTGWNKSRSAQLLGIERSTLDRKIRRYEITPTE